jgi:hypothetical protein
MMLAARPFAVSGRPSMNFGANSAFNIAYVQHAYTTGKTSAERPDDHYARRKDPRH